MKNIIILILIASLVVVSLITIGCSKPQSQETAPQEETALPEEVESPEVIELNFAHINPEVAPLCQLHRTWGDMIEEQSGGRVKFTYYFGGSLLKDVGGEMVRGVQAGVADIGYHALNPLYGFELSSFMLLPTLDFKSLSCGTKIYTDLLNKYPELQAEFGGLKWYAPRLMLPFLIHK